MTAPGSHATVCAHYRGRMDQKVPLRVILLTIVIVAVVVALVALRIAQGWTIGRY